VFKLSLKVSPLISISLFIVIASLTISIVNFSKAQEKCLKFDTARPKYKEVIAEETFSLLEDNKDFLRLKATFKLKSSLNHSDVYYHYTLLADDSIVLPVEKMLDIKAVCNETLVSIFTFSKNSIGQPHVFTLFTEQEKQIPDSIGLETYESILKNSPSINSLVSPQSIYIQNNLLKSSIVSKYGERIEQPDDSRIKFEENDLPYQKLKSGKLYNYKIMVSGVSVKSPVLVICSLNGIEVPISPEIKKWTGVFTDMNETLILGGKIKFSKLGWNRISCYFSSFLYSEKSSNMLLDQPSNIKKSYIYVE
jgi:hypothetical protein